MAGRNYSPMSFCRLISLFTSQRINKISISELQAVEINYSKAQFDFYKKKISYEYKYKDFFTKMGGQCFYFSKEHTRTVSDVKYLIEPAQQQALKEVESQIMSQLRSQVEGSQLLSTTLSKNYKLRSKCARMTRSRNMKDSYQTADKAITYNFTLSSQNHPEEKQGSQEREPSIQQMKEEESEKDSADEVLEMWDPAVLTFKEVQSKQRDLLRIKSLKLNKQIVTAPNYSSRKPLIFQRRDFLRIAKKNVMDLYEFKVKLGEGSQGAVYKAINRATQQCRAIKVLHKDSIRYEHDFFAEFETLRILDHPNIVKLYEIIEHNNHYYLVTQFCEGGSVVSQLKRMKSFNQTTVAAIMRDIIAAVVYMHQNNVIHRDMKLQNVVFERKMNSKGDQPPIKVIDFGTSKFLKQNSSEITESPAGTPLYIAPEVLDNHYDKKCDVWSCGVIMYILLCGRPPFKGRTKKEVYNKIQFSPVAFTGSSWNYVSNQAKHLIQKMLEKNCKWRISAEQVLNSHWILNCSNTEPIAVEVLRDMEKFYFKDKFLAVILTYLASSTLSQKRRRDLANVFMKIDKNHSGSIDIKEFQEAYKQVYPQTDTSCVENIFQYIDTDGSGKIDFTEFLVVAQKQQILLRKQSLQKAFDFFDLDKTGYLDLAQVKWILGETDSTEANKVMSEFDTNHDKKISKEEFISKILQKV